MKEKLELWEGSDIMAIMVLHVWAKFLYDDTMQNCCSSWLCDYLMTPCFCTDMYSLVPFSPRDKLSFIAKCVCPSELITTSKKKQHVQRAAASSERRKPWNLFNKTCLHRDTFSFLRLMAQADSFFSCTFYFLIIHWQRVRGEISSCSTTLKHAITLWGIYIQKPGGSWRAGGPIPNTSRHWFQVFDLNHIINVWHAEEAEISPSLRASIIHTSNMFTSWQGLGVLSDLQVICAANMRTIIIKWWKTIRCHRDLFLRIYFSTSPWQQNADMRSICSARHAASLPAQFQNDW